jgi:calcineurin-like phosphoesterase family protein
MNKTLVTKWNALVAPRDTVYFLGDWSFGRGSRPPKYWGRKLNGHIISIKGSHDGRAKGVRPVYHKVLHYKGYDFLLIHDPDQKPVEWHGWTIHGHKHNNELGDYPFINGERKTVNVSVELIDYQPIRIDRLLSLDIDSIRRMETVNSQPERWQRNR